MPLLKSRLMANVPVSLQVPAVVAVEESPMPGRVIKVSVEAAGSQLFLELSIREAEALRVALADELRDNADDWAPKQRWITLDKVSA